MLIVILLLAAAAGVFAYSQGYGYPTQETVVKTLFADPEAAASTSFNKDLSDERIAALIDPVVKDGDVTIEGVERSMNQSVVYAKANTEEGGDVEYKITLSRDLIGWKIANIELYFPSQSK